MDIKRLQVKDYLLLLAILLLAGYLRLTGLDWDGYRHYHPDERYIVWVGTTIAWPSAEQDFFDPQENALNPFYWPAEDLTEGIMVPLDEPREFAYGHLPLYMGVGMTRLIEQVAPAVRPWLPDQWFLTSDILNGDELIEFRHLLVVGRMTTALVDMGTILLLFGLGRRLFGTAAGLWSAALLSVTVLHVQLAHFFTTDPYTTFFVTAALAGMVAAVMVRPSRGGAYFYAAACLVGLAVGSKFSAVVLGAPLLLAAWLLGKRYFWRRLIVAGVLVLTAFAVSNPFALLDVNCEAITPAMTVLGVEIPALDWRSCYLENIGRQSVMVQGGAAFPFTRQYDGTEPYLYFIEMQLRWGMGWLLGILGFAGFVWVIGWCGWGVWRWWREGLQPSAVQMGCLMLLGWCIPYFVSTGNFYVKFMRYLQPIVPLLILFGVGMVFALPWKRVGHGVLAIVWAGTFLYALAFSQIYTERHPWIEASAWIYEHVEPESVIVSELWDEPLPTTIEVDGQLLINGQYERTLLTWLSGAGSRDTEEKLRRNLTEVAAADYLVISSNRVYGVAPRLPDVYPLSSQFHEMLFAGELGYELRYVTDRTPQLGGVYLYPDTFSWPMVTPPPEITAYLTERPGVSFGRVDESFTVYDQPLVMIFENVEKQSVETLLEAFERR